MRSSRGRVPLSPMPTSGHRYGDYLGGERALGRGLTQFARPSPSTRTRVLAVQHAMIINSGGRCYSARAGRLPIRCGTRASFARSLPSWTMLRFWLGGRWRPSPITIKGAWNDVIRVAEESLPIAWEIGETNVILFGSAWLGLAYLKVGRLAEARRAPSSASHTARRRFAAPSPLTYPPPRAALTHLAGGELPEAAGAREHGARLAERSRPAWSRARRIERSGNARGDGQSGRSRRSLPREPESWKASSASRAGPDPSGLRPVQAGTTIPPRANAHRARAGNLREDRRNGLERRGRPGPGTA